MAVMMLAFHVANPLLQCFADGGQHGLLQPVAHVIRLDLPAVDFEIDIDHGQPSGKGFHKI